MTRLSGKLDSKNYKNLVQAWSADQALEFLDCLETGKMRKKIKPMLDQCLDRNGVKLYAYCLTSHTGSISGTSTTGPDIAGRADTVQSWSQVNLKVHCTGLALKAMAMALAAAWVAAAGAQPNADASARVVKVVLAEALLPNDSPVGRPLPLAGHWNTANQPSGYTPAWQVEQIRKGHYLLPWLGFPAPGAKMEGNRADYYRPLEQFRAWDLPVCFRNTQWEADLYDKDLPWHNLPPDQNPCWVDLDGKVQKKVSPFGTVAAWRDAGRRWTDQEAVRQLERLYPKPPRILMLGNNEAGDLRWHQAEKDKRYIERHGLGRSDHFKRQVFAEGYIERYKALFAGLREGFASPAWRTNTIFVGYNALGPDHLGRWKGWPEYALHTEGRMSPWPLCWQGASPELYDNQWQPEKTFFRVWSPQIEGMNLVPMREDAMQLDPNHWLELSVWDGHTPGKTNDKRLFYEGEGCPATPERYAAWVQYCMWLLTPRVVREFRASTETLERTSAHFAAIMEAVDRVHLDPVLARFWRKGELVPNPAGAHPFQTMVPDYYKDRQRWFLLSTSADPPQPWTYRTILPVFALGRVLGDRPNREWIIYAHAPRVAQADVRITVPGYNDVTVNVPVAGAFWHIQEGTGTARPLH